MERRKNVVEISADDAFWHIRAPEAAEEPRSPPISINNDPAYWELPLDVRVDVAHTALLMCVLYRDIKAKNWRQKMRCKIAREVGDAKARRLADKVKTGKKPS